MRPDTRCPRLYVEGANDCRVICALMNVLGTELDEQKGPVIVEPQGSCTKLLEMFEVAYKSSLQSKNPVGFVLDWDRPEDNRAGQLRERFASVGCELSDADFTEDGIIKEISGVRVGVWLMPHAGAHAGKLEDFLRALIPQSDSILPLSRAYVGDVALSIPKDSRFRDVDQEKAELCAWLAVQRQPGESYALAVKSHALSVGSPVARKFHEWFCRLYGLA